MQSPGRRIYRLFISLHPAAFRREFAREMLFDFEEAFDAYGLRRLLLDAAGSLVRQWWSEISSTATRSISSPQPSLFAGRYVMVCDKSFTPLGIVLGLIASSTQLALCLFALGASPGHLPYPRIVYMSSSAPATPSDAYPEMTLPTGEGSAFKPSEGATASFGFSLPDMAQRAQPRPELMLFHPQGPLPLYEVATIKPIDYSTADSLVRLPPSGSLSPLSISRYIMHAYGATYALQISGGPVWLNKDAYRIEGKVRDELDSALGKMSREDRMEQTRMLEQSLLADRFHLKAHFETRMLPVYELVPAKGGLKITGVPAPPDDKPGGLAPSLHPGDSIPPGTILTTPNSNGLRVLNARAIKMPLLARVIGGDLGDRPIIDHSGFTGYFDVTNLTWAPLDAAATIDPDTRSLVGSLQEKLGIKVVSAKDPIEVLVIDSIERPTPN